MSLLWRPRYTYCDVERLFQERLADSRLLEIMEAMRSAEINRAGRATIARLTAKYEPLPEPKLAATLRQGNLYDLSS